MLEELKKIKAIRNYFLNSDIYPQFEEMIEKYKLPADRLDEFLDLADAMLDRKIKMSEMPGLLEKSFGLNKEDAILVATDIIGYRLLPLNNYLPGVDDQIKKWGGKIEDYPSLRVGKETAITEIILARVSERHKVSLPEYLRTRLANLAKAYLEKERSEKDTIELMKRPTNIGGLEMSEEASKNILKALADEKAKFVAPSEEAVVSEVIEKMTEKKVVEVKQKDVGAVSATSLKKNPEPQKNSSDQKLTTFTDEAQARDYLAARDAVPVTKKEDSNVTREELIALAKSLQDDIREIEGVEVDSDLIPGYAPTRQEMKNLSEQYSKSDTAKEEYPKGYAPSKDEIKRLSSENRASAASQDLKSDKVKGYAPSKKEMKTLVIEHSSSSNGKGSLPKGYAPSRQELDDLAIEHSGSKPAVSAKDLLVSTRKAAAAGQKQASAVSRGKKENLPAKTMTRALTKEVPIISGSMIDPHEEEEVRAGAAMIRKSKAKRSKAEKSNVEGKVNKLLQSIVPTFRRKRLNQKVFKEVAQGHVKGLREPLKTKQLLTDKYKFSDKDVSQIMDVLEQARKLAQGEHVLLRHQKDKQRGSATSQDEAKQSAKDRQEQKEREIFDKKHATLTKTVSDDKIEPMNSAQVSAARTKEEELTLQEKQIDADKLKAAQVASKPKKARAKLSIQSTPPDKKRGAKMVDIKFTKRLMGPVEELGSISPIEFRRLSSDPNEAIEKIKDKLMLLQRTAYE